MQRGKYNKKFFSEIKKMVTGNKINEKQLFGSHYYY